MLGESGKGLAGSETFQPDTTSGEVSGIHPRIQIPKVKRSAMFIQTHHSVGSVTRNNTMTGCLRSHALQHATEQAGIAAENFGGHDASSPPAVPVNRVEIRSAAGDWRLVIAHLNRRGITVISTSYTSSYFTWKLRNGIGQGRATSLRTVPSLSLAEFRQRCYAPGPVGLHRLHRSCNAWWPLAAGPVPRASVRILPAR